MEPRKEVLIRSPQPGEEAKKSRFQIIKLEERIAPGCKFNPNAGPWSTATCYGGYACYSYRVKYGKYVGKC
jgi:hypothetical protein